MAHRGATEGPLGHDPAWGHLDLRLAVPRIRRVTAEDYLAAYDAQLRIETETPSAISVTELGPLRLATFAGGRRLASSCIPPKGIAHHLRLRGLKAHG